MFILIRYILLSLLALQSVKSFYLGSFNIQSLGPTKIARPEFVSVVVKVLSKYDIVLIQEIKDISQSVLTKLVAELNNYVRDKGVIYSFAISPRLGSGSYKEQYAFLYQTNDGKSNRKINLKKEYVFTDSYSIFERPPHVGQFEITSSTLSIKNFFILNVHLRPNEVLSEGLGLRDVVDQILLENPSHYDGIAIMGDWNFDCTYISEKNRNIVKAKLFEFKWFISDKVETTISASNCAYDRLIIAGNTFQKAIIPKTNKTYYYNLEFGLNMDETKKISDHYPIEIELK